MTLKDKEGAPLFALGSRVALFVYVGVLLYGLFIPQFQLCHGPCLELGSGKLYPLAFLPESATLKDAVANLFAFFVLGWLVVSNGHRAFGRPILWVAIAVVAGTCLSVSAELAQQYLPGRVPSGIDMLVDGLGVFLGGSMAALAGPL